MNDFSQKYLKYKTKYLNSKNVVSMNMKGGSLINGKVQFVDSLTPINEAGIGIQANPDLCSGMGFDIVNPYGGFSYYLVYIPTEKEIAEGKRCIVLGFIQGSVRSLDYPEYVAFNYSTKYEDDSGEKQLITMPLIKSLLEDKIVNPRELHISLVCVDPIVRGLQVYKHLVIYCILMLLPANNIVMVGCTDASRVLERSEHLVGIGLTKNEDGEGSYYWSNDIFTIAKSMFLETVKKHELIELGRNNPTSKEARQMLVSPFNIFEYSKMRTIINKQLNKDDRMQKFISTLNETFELVKAGTFVHPSIRK